MRNNITNDNVFNFTLQQIYAIHSLVDGLKSINCDVIDFIENGAILSFYNKQEDLRIIPVIITFNDAYTKIYNVIGLDQKIQPLLHYFMHRFDYDTINYREEIKKVILKIISA